MRDVLHPSFLFLSEIRFLYYSIKIPNIPKTLETLEKSGGVLC